MKILNREEFLALPEGTLYHRYKPCYLEGLEIKWASLNNDWVYTNLIEVVDNEGSSHRSDILIAAEEEGTPFPVDFDNTGRDGCYEADQLFAVYEPDEIRQLIDKLQSLL